MPENKQQSLVSQSEPKRKPCKSLNEIKSIAHDDIIQPDGSVIPYNYREESQFVIRTSDPSIPFGLGDGFKDIPVHHQKWVEKIIFWSEIRKQYPFIVTLALASVGACTLAIVVWELLK